MDYHIPLKVPMSNPDLSEAEREAVIKVIGSSHLSLGPYLKAFEEAVCNFIGCRHAIAVNSGTSGLHLCIHASRIKTDDLVITTPFSFVSSTNVILFEKAIPVYVDVDPITGNIDPVLVQQAAQDLIAGGKAARRWLPRLGAAKPGPLKAILGADVFGQPADFAPLDRTARLYDLRLINDSCESLGAEYMGRKAGTLGDYGVFAFYPNKQITTGEGGIIVTDDDQAALIMSALRNQGRIPGDTWLDHTLMGYNYRMDEMSAALGAVQMSRLTELLAKREQVAHWYDELLAGIDGVEYPVVVPTTTRVSWFVYVVRLAPGLDRTKVSAQLQEKGIPVRPYFSPIHLQPYMRERFGYREGDFPITEDLGRRGMALPFSGKMTREQVELVCKTIKETI